MPAEVFFISKKSSKKINLNEFIDKNSIQLRDEFLTKIQNLSKKKFLKKNLKDHFQFNKHINLWELSHIYEKNIFKEDYINICLHYLAILMIVKNYKLKKIILNNIDTEVSKILKKYNNDIKFEIHTQNEIKLKKFLKIFLLGNWFFSTLFFIKNNLFTFKNYSKNDHNKKNLIISYFCHYEKNFIKKSYFVSNHWKGLEKIIRKNFFYLNLFVASKEFKTYKKLKKNLSNKNLNLQEQNFLNNYFSFIDLIKTIFVSFFYSLKFSFIYIFLKMENRPQIELLELTYKIQKRSFSGITCYENLKCFYSLKNFFKFNPNIKNCIYLMENHSWEKILIKFCFFNKITSYGYVHATMPFWHLNYYQTKISNKKNLNLPNKILTVSKFNMKLLKKQGIKTNKIKLVEALRYNWLNKYKKIENYNKNLKKILIFGDYEKKINEKLIELMVNFLLENKDYIIHFKPHPGDTKDYHKINNKIKIIYDLPKKLKFSFFIFSNSTSASAEYTHLTDNIAIFKSQFSINLSPFKDLTNNKIFFSNENELLDIINSNQKKKFENFFYINKKMINWKKLIYSEKF